MSETTALLAAHSWYVANQPELLKKYNGRVLLIHDNAVTGDFKSKAEAFYAGKAQFKPGTFMIIKCTPGDSEYTVDYRTVYRFSRLAVA